MYALNKRVSTNKEKKTLKVQDKGITGVVAAITYKVAYLIHKGILKTFV